MRIVFLLGLLPALAFGQSITLDLNSGGQTAIFENGGQCNDLVTVNWTAVVPGVPCAPFDVFATTAASCPDAPAANDFAIGSEPNVSAGSGTFTFRVNQLLIFDGGTCPTAVDQLVNICGTYKASQLGCGVDNPAFIHASPVPTLRFDAIPPAAPVVTAVNSLDSSLGVRVSPGNDTSTVTVQYRVAGSTGAFTKLAPYSAQNGGTTINNLVNGTTYEIQAIVSDEANNDSAPSASKTGVPEPTSGFWANYVQDGGQENGGCNAVGPTSLGLLIIAAAFGRARRKS